MRWAILAALMASGGCIMQKPPPTTPAAPTVPNMARMSGSPYVVEVYDSVGNVVARWQIPAGSTIKWPEGSKLLPPAGVKEK